MPADLLLGVDVGSTRMKAALFDTEGRQVALTYDEYPILHNEPLAGEHGAANWLSSFKSVVRRVIRKGLRSCEANRGGVSRLPMPVPDPSKPEWQPTHEFDFLHGPQKHSSSKLDGERNRKSEVLRDHRKQDFSLSLLRANNAVDKKNPSTGLCEDVQVPARKRIPGGVSDE